MSNLQEKNNRTIAISNSNFNFFKKNFCNIESKKIFWPIDRIKIYDDKINVSELLDFNSPVKNENIAYVGYNNKIQFFLEKQINKNLKTSYLKLDKIKKIIKNKNSYQLIHISYIVEFRGSSQILPKHSKTLQHPYDHRNLQPP